MLVTNETPSVSYPNKISSEKKKKTRDITLPTKVHIVKARASLVAQLVKNPPAMQETWAQSLGWEDPLEKEKDIPFFPLLYSGLENSMDCIVQGVAKSWTC